MLGFSLVMDPIDLRALRARHSWTQKKLAELLGTDPVTVSRWERGKSQPRPSAVARLETLASGLPSDIQSLVSLVGAAQARSVLKRASLLNIRLPKQRFEASPTRRLKQVERALEEQLDLKTRARMQR